MPERGRGTETGTKNRSRSRSRVRRVKNGEEKPIRSRLKKIMKGMARISSRNGSDMGSIGSKSAATSPAQIETASVKSENRAPITTNIVAPPSLQLVLLLVDPDTRRFELLQLDFDSTRARVVDILKQIPLSVTESVILNQQYEGVLVESGLVMKQDARLVDFCESRQVLVALPERLPAKDCVRLARPIFADKQVNEMLGDNGFDVSKWLRKDGASSQVPKERKLAMPPIAEPAAKAKETKAEKSGNFFPVLAALTVLAIMAQAAQNFLTSPIEAGVVLPPGSWRSRCGIMGYIPLPEIEGIPKCTNSVLEVNKDGSVSIFGEDGDLEMLMVGGVCDSDDCVDGLVMDEDSILYVGGRRVKTVQAQTGDAALAPWPFAETPRVKIKRSNLS